MKKKIKPKKKTSASKKNVHSQSEKKEIVRSVQLGGGTRTKATPDQMMEFLEQARMLANPDARLPSKLISMKVPVPLLKAFKFKCNYGGIAYQTQIKRLMEAWLKEPTAPDQFKD